MFCYVVERRVWTSLLWVVGLALLAWGVYKAVAEQGNGAPTGRPVTHPLAQLSGPGHGGPGFAGGAQPEESLIAAEEGEDVQTEPVTTPLPAPVAVDLEDVESVLAELGRRDEAEGDAFTAGPGGPGLYEEYRLERERLRARRLEAIQRLVDDPQASEERRWEAQRMLLELLADQSREVELEYLLRARGYEDAIVAIAPDYANVAVTQILTEQDAARIGELVNRVAGVPLQRIAIVDGYGKN